MYIFKGPYSDILIFFATDEWARMQECYITLVWKGLPGKITLTHWATFEAKKVTLFQAMRGFGLTHAYKRYIYLCGGFQGDNIDGLLFFNYRCSGVTSTWHFINRILHQPTLHQADNTSIAHNIDQTLHWLDINFTRHYIN